MMHSHSHLTILFVCTILWAAVDSTSISPNSVNPNCPTNLRNLRKEHEELKLQKENETKEYRHQVAQLKNEIESLKSKFLQSQQNFSTCTNLVVALTSQNEFWQNRLDTILNETRRNGDNIEVIRKDSLRTLLFQSEISKVKFKLFRNPSDCSEVRLSGRTESGVYNIYPEGANPVQVYCDMTSDGGGWTVFMQRGNRGTQREDFYKNWTQYQVGFGNVEGGDYNIGLNALHTLTSTNDQQLRVDFSDFDGNSAYANYKTFWIGGSDEKYRLTIGNYSGNAGDGLAYHNGQKFSTFDQDNDPRVDNFNCAVFNGGAWWYNNCHYSHLTGKYYNEGKLDHKGFTWYYWKNKYESLKSAEMKIRPAKFDEILQGTNYSN